MEINRKMKRAVKVGPLTIGGGFPIVVQSMAAVKTSKVDDVLRQIKEAIPYGLELMRVSVLDEEDGRALARLTRESPVPIVADIHFDYRLALLAAENGVAAIRINPGNIGSEDRVKAVVEACRTRHIPIRIGINGGSLFKDHEATPEEMVELFKDLPEAVNNTIVIAERCSFLSEKIQPLLPIFECPDGKTQDEFITEEAYKGLKERMEAQVYFEGMTDEQKKEIDEKYYARLDYELSVIKKMGFPGYFLIVSDFIRWSKGHGVPVGPGRGSGAGSITAWSLKVTDLDPIKLDLLFERFLNPERINMPDFDVDFCQENRGKTIEYVQNKYGFDHVAQIITYGKLQANNVIRDGARVLQMPYSQADRLSKMIPPGVQGKNPTLQESLDQVPELEEMRQNDPQVNKLFDIGMKLEGLYRQSGVHAAGVVIGDRPLDELVPLYKDPRAEMPVTQYDMKYVEETGLIKFDFLGLKTLTVIQRAVDWIKKIHGVQMDMDNVPLDDKPTYELLQSGNTAAVFQFESAGMQDVHKQIKPDRFEDLIAIVSLYRPGPMDNIPSYIKRKHGEEEITYLHPMLEPILKETYGIMIYQEQVMNIARALGGYTMGGGTGYGVASAGGQRYRHDRRHENSGNLFQSHCKSILSFVLSFQSVEVSTKPLASKSILLYGS